MTRETRIALLLGLAIIILFGLVLGQRTLKLPRQSVQSPPVKAAPRPLHAPGPELMSVRLQNDARPVLSPRPARVARARPARVDAPARRTTAPAGTGRPPAARASAPSRPAQQGRARAAPRAWTVRAGDNLTKIAQRVYGPERGEEYVRIFRANTDKLRDASTLRVGQVLVIPPLQGATPSARGEGTAPGPPPARPGASRPAEPARLARAPRRGPAHYTEVTLEALAERLGARRRSGRYVVRSGDSLTAIARRTLGTGSRAAVRKLFDANRDRLADPDSLPVGLELRIPN